MAMDDTQHDKEYPEPPEGIKVLSNGAGYDTVKKRIAHAPGTFGPFDHPITVENNAEFQARRWAKARETAAQAIANGTKQPDVFGGWFTVIAAQTELAINPRMGRSSTEAAKFIGRAADLLPDKRNDTPTNQANIQINVTSEALQRILCATGGQSLDITPTNK